MHCYSSLSRLPKPTLWHLESPLLTLLVSANLELTLPHMALADSFERLCTGLCQVPIFIEAYAQCLIDNCSPEEVQSGILLGQQVCASSGAAIRECTTLLERGTGLNYARLHSDFRLFRISRFCFHYCLERAHFFVR